MSILKSYNFTILWPILHQWNAKAGNNLGIIGNLKRIIGSFLGIKEYMNNR